MRRQDILVSVLHCIGLSALRRWLCQWRGETVTRFVTFHDVAQDGSTFEDNLVFLRRRTHVVSLDDFMSGKLSTRRINVVITFDDGYQSWVTAALPVLRRLRLPATFFVSSGFVGLASPQQSTYLHANLGLPPGQTRDVEGLSERDLRALADEGHTIGGHTVSHIDMSACNDLAVLTREVINDKLRLERILGRRIDYFAFPRGSFRNPQHALPAILQAAGYRGAVTTVSGFNTRETDRYLLHRDLTNARMPGLAFRARVYGNADAALFLRQRLMRLMDWPHPARRTQNRLKP